MESATATVKAESVQRIDPAIPNTVIKIAPTFCTTANLEAGGAVGGSVGATGSKAAIAAVEISKTLSVEDVEKGFLWCVANSVPATSTVRKCDVQILAAKTGATTDAAGSTKADISATFEHSITCPTGVTISQQDLTGDICTCFKRSVKQVTSIEFNGLCTGVIKPTQKRAMQQSGSSTFGSTTLNTRTASESSAFSSIAQLFLIAMAIVVCML
jgi:hypothetical protein